MKIRLYSQGDVEPWKAMKCEESSCYGAPHFIHAVCCLSICLVPDTLALLPLSVCCVSANTFALSITVACVGLHLRTGDKNTLIWMTEMVQYSSGNSKTKIYILLIMNNMQTEKSICVIDVISYLFIHHAKRFYLWMWVGMLSFMRLLSL